MNKKSLLIVACLLVFLCGGIAATLNITNRVRQSQHDAHLYAVVHNHVAVVEAASRKASQRVRLKEEELNHMNISIEEKHRRLNLEKQLAMAELKQTETLQERSSFKAMDQKQ